MSHTTKVKVEHKFDSSMENILREACKKQGLTLLPWGEHKLYNSRETGYAVKLPGWKYPAVLNAEGIAMDNYNGSWGDEAKLKRFLRRVSAEKIIKDARRKGYTIAETEIDGEIKLTLTGGDLDA